MINAKFKVGDVVEPKVSAGVKHDKRAIMYGPDQRYRYLVLEACTQECHGGVQLFYRCRGVSPYGRADPELRSFYEPELVLSRPFAEDEPHDVVEVPPAP